MKKQYLTISEAAKELKVETHVLRYWEEELEIEVPRNDMGHREYSEHEMRLFRGVIELKKQGFQLRIIKLLIQDMMNGEELDIEKLIAMRDEIQRRIAFLNEEGIEVEESFPEIMRNSLIRRKLANAEEKNSTIETTHSEDQATNLLATIRQKRLGVDATGKVTNLEVFKSMQKRPQLVQKDRVQQMQDLLVQAMGDAVKNQTVDLIAELKEEMKLQLSQELTTGLVNEVVRQMSDSVANEVVDKMSGSMANEVAKQVSGTVANDVSNQVVSAIDDTLSNQVSDEISTRVIKELNYLARMQEEQEEERFKRVDAMLREHQQRGKRQKKKLFGRKNDTEKHLNSARKSVTEKSANVDKMVAASKER